jgi:hypothetical protein
MCCSIRIQPLRGAVDESSPCSCILVFTISTGKVHVSAATPDSPVSAKRCASPCGQHLRGTCIRQSAPRALSHVATLTLTPPGEAGMRVCSHLAGGSAGCHAQHPCLTSRLGAHHHGTRVYDAICHQHLMSRAARCCAADSHIHVEVRIIRCYTNSISGLLTRGNGARVQRESTTVRRLRREVARLIMLPPPNKASTPGASWPIESYPLEMRSSVVTGALVRDWFQAEGALVARFDLEVSKVFEPIVSLPVKKKSRVWVLGFRLTTYKPIRLQTRNQTPCGL